MPSSLLDERCPVCTDINTKTQKRIYLVVALAAKGYLERNIMKVTKKKGVRMDTLGGREIPL
jgi:hypothetical protein